VVMPCEGSPCLQPPGFCAFIVCGDLLLLRDLQYSIGLGSGGADHEESVWQQAR
jgi:hypothetical protein